MTHPSEDRDPYETEPFWRFLREAKWPLTVCVVALFAMLAVAEVASHC